MIKSNYNQHKQVAVWLYIGVFIIVVQVLLGGITRLTGSGLSITEWKPILGTIPPLNEQAWQEAFLKYQQIAQYELLNSHFSLSDFKAIYFWEWFHRNWARFMGLVFIIPFVYFIFNKKIDKKMIKPMIILFLLGALQGLIGWIMVKSGLNDKDVAVSYFRLAIHFVAALVLLCYVLWFALSLSVNTEKINHLPSLKKLNIFLLILMFFQLIYGAFMAGSHAALAAKTWPDINGMWWPDGIFKQGGFVNDILHNLYTIQFIHRGLAYILTLLIIYWSYLVTKLPKENSLYKWRFVPSIVVIFQVIIGVLTLLNSEFNGPIFYGVLHQFVGMLLLMVLFITLFLSNKSKASN